MQTTNVTVTAGPHEKIVYRMVHATREDAEGCLFSDGAIIPAYRHTCGKKLVRRAYRVLAR